MNAAVAACTDCSEIAWPPTSTADPAETVQLVNEPTMSAAPTPIARSRDFLPQRPAKTCRDPRKVNMGPSDRRGKRLAYERLIFARPDDTRRPGGRARRRPFERSPSANTQSNQKRTASHISKRTMTDCDQSMTHCCKNR